MKSLRPIILTVAASIGYSFACVATQAASTGDAWLAKTGIYPSAFRKAPPDLETFRALKAEVLLGEISPFWPTSLAKQNAIATLWFSVDYAGHWPARDWRHTPMSKLTTGFESKLPTSDLSVPIIYFVAVESAGKSLVSPMRIVLPGKLGLQKPSTIFWPFLEGFEEGTDSWQLAKAKPDAERLSIAAGAHSGDAALHVRIPAGKQSVTIETTRVRGWHFHTQSADGVRIWLKTSGKNATARFKLISNARTDGEQAGSASITAELNGQWKSISLPTSVFSSVRLSETDLFSIEFIADGPAEFFVDDLQLIGRWKLPQP